MDICYSCSTIYMRDNEEYNLVNSKKCRICKLAKGLLEKFNGKLSVEEYNAMIKSYVDNIMGRIEHNF